MTKLDFIEEMTFEVEYLTHEVNRITEDLTALKERMQRELEEHFRHAEGYRLQEQEFTFETPW